jgi:ATP diphosphatase
VEDELGDLLFSVVNLARRLKLDPSLALSRSVDKFERRFAGVHRELQRRRVTDPSPALFEELWELVKKRS